MAQYSIRRHYPLYNLDFRDFWDICSHFQRSNRDCRVITYSLFSRSDSIILRERDVGEVLRTLATNRKKITLFEAEFHTDVSSKSDRDPKAKLSYYPALIEDQESGLYLQSQDMSKLMLFKFEDLLKSNYSIEEVIQPVVELGTPCEVLVASIDIRGFTAFCEQPNIESPYTCGLMSSFYHMIRTAFSQYQPGLIKFNGDGVLALWQTNAEDRQVAIDTCLKGSASVHGLWQTVRSSPHFSHGAPADVGVGMSFGLASKLSFGNDYIGRPINISSRLCSICPGGKLYIDKSIPGIPDGFDLTDTRVRIKSLGEYAIWAMQSL